MCSFDKPFLKKKSVLLINLSLFFFDKQEMFFSALSRAKTFSCAKKKSFLCFRKNVFILVFLAFLKISLASFLHTSFVYPFFHPFFFFSLLDSLSCSCLPLGFFSLRFFSSLFSPFFTLFSLFCFSSSFWCTFFLFLVLPSGCDCCLGPFFFRLSHLLFFFLVFSTFF